MYPVETSSPSRRFAVRMPTAIRPTVEEASMADGTVRRSPEIVAVYTMIDGRFSLNLFVKNGDGTIASESTVGRYTFRADKYCERITHTIRNNLDKPGITNDAPAVTDHCTLVTSKDGRFSFSPPGRRGGQLRAGGVHREDRQ